ncbi:hypothetical protein I7Z51_002593 [Vibrio parahaemolyticus]|uniref:hypothetical protein n=1 Tax=Vibrio TaxID=662 RepID=UPI001A8E62F5|nr:MULTISPECIES: hypothetical protein [Vibrio]EGQ7973668.1 hypothetical protein [Vibrio parahaemolyticus]MBO0209878.1 hypothetical protein [Vibrio sp. Vb0877]MCR9811940.1 hypothetical protein [Vibrio parahaemolyticus]
MSKPQQLQHNVDYIRCNLRVLRDTHPELFEHLEDINEKGRAEEVRYLMRLGLLVRNGQLGGLPASNVVQQPTNPEQVVSVADSPVELDAATTTSRTNSPPPKDTNTVTLQDSDLDFGDDLLGLD